MLLFKSLNYEVLLTEIVLSPLSSASLTMTPKLTRMELTPCCWVKVSSLVALVEVLKGPSARTVVLVPEMLQELIGI